MSYGGPSYPYLAHGVEFPRLRGSLARGRVDVDADAMRHAHPQDWILATFREASPTQKERLYLAALERVVGMAAKYPEPTTDADEFVAGMVAAHEGGDSLRDRIERAVHDLFLHGDARWSDLGLDERAVAIGTRRSLRAIADAAVTVVNECGKRQRVEILNEAMEWDPQP